MNDKPFNVIKATCPEFYEWLKEISRYSKVENFVLPDYKNRINVKIYTHDYRYSISIRPKGEKNEKDEGYLGCIVTTRKPRVGEDWNRENDLPDGKYCKETWDSIKNAIIGYELVKIPKLKTRCMTETEEGKN